MNRVGQFEKVIFEQFKKDYLQMLLSGADYKDLTKDEENALLQAYETIILPARATSGSAGYDFISPIDFMICPEKSIVIPTGIRAKMDEGWFLGVFPIDNTVKIIDRNYYYSDNQGHILIRITNNSKSTVFINGGRPFAQGIFIQFGITYKGC